MDFTIALARPQDLAALGAIELAAAALLRDHAPGSVLAETTPLDELALARAERRLWVALHEDAPIGFALIERLDDGTIHLEEVDVHPDFGRRGVGAALVRAVCDWARGAGHEAVTLTTFRALPFNMPFYARLGFAEVPADTLTAELVAVVGDEAARGLDPGARVVMRRRLRGE